MAEQLVKRLESNRSNWIKAHTLDMLAPGKVAVTGYTVSQGRVNLQWESITTSDIVEQKLSGDGATKVFQLLFVDIASSTVVVKVDGITKALNTDYTVDYAAGILNFKDASIPAEGTDNIVVEYRKELKNLAGYRIYRKATSSDQWTLLTTVSKGSKSFSDTTMMDGANYFYAVSAVDGEDTPNEGEMSDMLTVKTVPSVPQNLVASSGEGVIRLSWKTVINQGDPKINENLHGYRVYRNTTSASGQYEFLVEIVGDVTIFEDDTVLNGQDYWYVVTAVDDSTDNDRQVEG